MSHPAAVKAQVPSRPSASSACLDREHRWDFARAMLMLLGIPYHVAMCLRLGEPWIVASPRGGEAYTWIADGIHLFRMPAFFLVAGYFAAMLLTRRPAGAWLRGRMVKLGIPFLASLVLVVPVLNIACELSGRDPTLAGEAFARNMAQSGGYWIRHLWFLIVLGYHSVLAAGMVALFPWLAHARLPAPLDRGMALRLPIVLVAVGLAIGGYGFVAALPFRDIGTLGARRFQEILRLDEAMAYLPWFALGAIIERAPLVRDAFARWSPMTAATGLVVGSLAVAGRSWSGMAIAAPLLASVAAVLLTQALLGIARTWFDRPSAIIDAMVAAAFPIYLFHLPVAAILLLIVMPFGWPLVLEFAFVCVATLAISFGLARLVRRWPALHLLFAGVRPPRHGRPSCIQSRAGRR